MTGRLKKQNDLTITRQFLSGFGLTDKAKKLAGSYAAAKEARMRLPTQKTECSRPVTIGTDSEVVGWHLKSLDYEKLDELQSRLMRLRQLGGHFAELSLSPEAETRMAQLRDFSTGS